MTYLIYPSRWRRNRDGVVVHLTQKLNLAQGTYGVNASSLDRQVYGDAYWTKVPDRKGRLSFSLLHVQAEPKRSGLGSLLMYAFAHSSDAFSVEYLNISTANPGERGFYMHLGFHNSKTHTRLIEQQMMDSPSRAMAYLEVKDYPSGEGTVRVMKKDLLTELVAKTAAVKLRTQASMRRAWTLV